MVKIKITNQEERDSRIGKITEIAAGATTAVMLFNKTGLRKFASQASRAINDASTGIGKEVARRSFRDFDYKTIKGIYNKHIVSDTSKFQKAFDSNQKITSSLKSRLAKNMQDIKSFEASKSGIIKKMQDSQAKTQILNKLNKEMSPDKASMKKLTQVVNNVIENKNRFILKQTGDDGTIIGRGLNKNFDDMIKGTALEKHVDEIKDIINNEYNDIEDSGLMQQIEDEFNRSLKDEIKGKMEDNIIAAGKKEGSNFFDDLLERAASVKDVIEARNNNGSEMFDEATNDIIDDVIEFKKRHADEADVIDNMTFSDDIRMFKGELYSGKGFEDSIDFMKEDLADTIPGKLFGARSFLDKKKAPSFFYFGKSSYDANLAALTGSKDGLLNDDFMYIMGKTYKIGSGGTLKHQENLDDLELISGVHGVFNVLNDRLHGNFQYRKNSNKFLDALSINTTGSTFIDSVKGVFNKYQGGGEDWKRNRLEKVISGNFVTNPLDPNYGDSIFDNFEAAKELSSLFKNTVKAPTKKDIHEANQIINNKHARKLLMALNHENPLDYILENDMEKSIHGNLKTIINGYKRDKRYVNNLVKIGNLGGLDGLNVLHGKELIEREILKSSIALEAATGKQGGQAGYARFVEKINNSTMNGNNKDYLKRMTHWVNLEKIGNLDERSLMGEMEANQLLTSSLSIADFFSTSSRNGQVGKYEDEMVEDLRKLINENTSIFDSEKIKNPDTINGHMNNKWVTIQKTKTIDVLGMISDMNNYLKDEGMKLGDTKTAGVLKQFIAGRDNPEDITLGTLLPYHLLNRLITPMDKFGIGFDPRHTKSVGDLAKNIMTKRVLPIALGATTLSYLNYESENLTGTSLEGAYENSKANAVLGIKQLQSATGLDENAKRNRMNNPIAEYLFGEYQDEEEYLDYLEYGSDPVRKGRFWSFGSTSEFRGGKIAYWEPNSLRQAHSNYRDIALYGSSDEKWSRSLMPSLRYPLSPLKFLMNPYWVEDLNYEDRPYPVSGKLFSEGTPWGAILNPTIGQIIKPQKRMHREDLLGLNDSRSIINDINLAIKNNAKESSVGRIDEGGVTPIGLTPKGMPSMDGAIVNFGLEEGKLRVNGVRGADFAENLPGIEYASMPIAGSLGNSRYENILPVNSDNQTIAGAMLDTMNTNSYNYGDRVNPNILIAQLNHATKYAGNVDDVVTTERARLGSTPHREATANAKDDYLKSLNLHAQSDALLNIASSAKELGGMYGFMFEQIIPSKKGYRLAEAGDMTSFARGFWDENIGGMGGDFMEIARRFFPHENHNLESVNPLRNTQPMWLPERFWTGDPYTSLPKGEARLPGRGYEALNKLHSDKYGRYGAFDRFKILADVSPGSEEYKIWKKIAKEEVRDPNLIKQMNVIEKQADEQIKEHDFYDYRFLTKKMKNQNAVIETVNNDGTFTVTGDEQVYALAGLDIDGRQDTVHNYLKGGMEVTLKYEDNDYNKFRNPDPWKKNEPPAIAAIVEQAGENIGAKMFDDKAAKEMDESEKTTLADNIFTASSQDISMGHVWEAIGHARIPYFHNKFLRINSPMESYKHEQVYGTAYATWDHPIKGFIEPAFREAWSKGPIAQAVGVGTWALSEWARTTDLDSSVKKAAHGLFAMTNPAAFAGGLMGALPRMSVGSGNGILNAKNGARVGALVGLGGYAISHLENPLTSALNFGVLGAAAMNQLKPEVGKGLAKEVLDTKFGAIAGVAIGIGLSTLKNPDFKLSNLRETYIPEDTKKKWDIEEYFDRLNYLKYDALYRKAARKAEDKEGVDIERMFNAYEWNREKNAEKRQELEELKIKTAKMISDPSKREKYLQEMDLKIEKLETPEQYFSLGEYARSAIAFKKARDTTIYGLNNFSSKADVLRALPKYDRDYFLEFAKEKDPNERKEILRYVSPYKAKALKSMWGEEVENEESHREYFGNHNLPGLFWAGWKPDVDMDHVKMKTIENEGMLLSDFGMYESAKYEPAAIDAPELSHYKDSGNALAIQSSIQGMLGGLGLVGVDVSVDSSASQGFEVIANVATIGAQKVSSIGNSFINLFI